MGRRVEKKVFVHTGSAWPGTPATIRRFTWYNWLMLVEYEDDSGTNRVKRAYTWGLDLSQNSLESAGGIGGLVAFEDRAATASTGDDVPYFVFFDTHGNVGQIVASEDDYGAASGAGWHTDRLAARYEYDAFGIVVGPDDDSDDNWRDDAGSYASDNPIRFSTKYFDDETAPDQGAGGSPVGLSSPFAASQGLGYWGYRFYGPRWGRWTNRDPIEEAGGENLYGAMENAPTVRRDSLGEWSWVSCGICVAALIGDYGGALAGCVSACLEYSNENISPLDCVVECLFSYVEDRQDPTLINRIKDAIQSGSCGSCLATRQAKWLKRFAKQGANTPGPSRAECLSRYLAYKVACKVPGPLKIPVFRVPFE